MTRLKIKNKKVFVILLQNVEIYAEYVHRIRFDSLSCTLARVKAGVSRDLLNIHSDMSETQRTYY